jgi:hypothetical protein
MKRYNLLAICLCLVIASCGGISQGIKGKLTDKIFGDPIVGVTVKIVAYDTPNIDTYPVELAKDGSFEMKLDPGHYRIEVEDERQDYVYGRIVEPFKIEENKLYEHVYKMDPVVKQWIHGIVTDKDSKKPIANATIKFGKHSAVTDKKGEYLIKNYRPATVKLEVTAKDYAPLVTDFHLTAGETAKDIELTSSSLIEGANVKPLINHISYVIETSQGTSKEDQKTTEIITVNNNPFAVKIETDEETVVQFMSKYFKIDGKKNTPITKEIFDKTAIPTYQDHIKMIEGAFAKFNSLKKSISTDIIKQDSANLVSYKYSYDYNGTAYECELTLYFDGNLEGFAKDLTFKASGKFIKFDFKDFSLPKNNINIVE